ncbi:MAG TPA: hypothetical protein GX005_01650 [Bacteroidales bacterium]|nr:hypothetical protein [Bacteroidales bacterium]
MDRSQKRILRLREHVLGNRETTGVEDDLIVNSVENKENESTEYSELTIGKLKELLDQRGIEYNSRTKKDDLIKLIEGAD